MNNNELIHHGVKGMKWGVRRTPEQLGRVVVKKGSYIQSMSKDSVKKAKGSMYVSYTDKDNNFYEKTLSDYYTLNGGKSVYKNVYKVKRDIIVPNDKTAMREFYSIYSKDRERIDSYMDKVYGKEVLEPLRKRINNGTATPEDVRNHKLITLQSMYYDDVVKNEYFKRLRKKGYNAVRDYFDYGYTKTWSGVQVDDPLIIFDSKKLMKLSKSTLIPN